MAAPLPKFHLKFTRITNCQHQIHKPKTTEPMLFVLCRRDATPRAKPRRAFICSLTPHPKAQIAIFILDRISLLRRAQPLPSLTTSSIPLRRNCRLLLTSAVAASIAAAPNPQSSLCRVFSLPPTGPARRLQFFRWQPHHSVAVVAAFPWPAVLRHRPVIVAAPCPAATSSGVDHHLTVAALSSQVSCQAHALVNSNRCPIRQFDLAD